jgi:hypothetical protein
MDATYDIFKYQPEGPIWIEAVSGLQNIKQRLLFLNETSPGEYFAYGFREGRIIEQISSELMETSESKHIER